MRTLLLTALITLCPFTLRAQPLGPGDTLDSCKIDGKTVPLAVCDSLIRLSDSMRGTDTVEHFGYTAPCPIISLDSASLARIERIIDSMVQDRIDSAVFFMAIGNHWTPCNPDDYEWWQRHTRRCDSMWKVIEARFGDTPWVRTEGK